MLYYITKYMASFFQLFIISVSVAMDALSVSIAGGIKSPKLKVIDAVKIAGFFGFFQAAMPLIGWLIGEVLSNVLNAITNWIAFALLTIIGIKMIKDSLDHHAEVKNILNNKTLTLLAIATSLDALIVGITLGIMKLPLLLSISVIGVITFLLCFLGYLFGSILGNKFGKRIEIVGGIILIVIGVKVLLENFI